MLWKSVILAGAALTGLASAAPNPARGTWRVNFYSSKDCSEKSLTSSYTGTSFYDKHTVSPPGKYLKVTKEGRYESYDGAFACHDDQNRVCKLVRIGDGCVEGPDGGANNFLIF